MARSGMTIPFDGISLSDQRPWIEELEDLGYTDVWSSEAQGADAFIPLALAAAWAPSLRLGTAIVPAFTRARYGLNACSSTYMRVLPFSLSRT